MCVLGQAGLRREANYQAFSGTYRVIASLKDSDKNEPTQKEKRKNRTEEHSVLVAVSEIQCCLLVSNYTL